MNKVISRIIALVSIAIIALTSTQTVQAAAAGNQISLYFNLVTVQPIYGTNKTTIDVEIKGFDGYKDIVLVPPASIVIESIRKSGSPGFDQLTACFANYTCVKQVSSGVNPYWGPGVLWQQTANARWGSNPRSNWSVLSLQQYPQGIASGVNTSEGDAPGETVSKMYGKWEVTGCVREVMIRGIQDNGAVTNWQLPPEQIYYYLGDLNC